jgi:hypothetical protein
MYESGIRRLLSFAALAASLWNGSIPLECSQFRGPISVSGSLISLSHLLLYFLGCVVHSFEQSLDSGVHLVFMLVVTQVMWCDLLFQAFNNCVGFLWQMKC